MFASTRRFRTRRRLVAGAAMALVLSGCSPGEPTTTGSTGARAEPPASSASESTGSRPPPSQLPAALSWGPSRQQFNDATAAVAQMTLAQKAGQVLVQSYSGTDPGAAVERIKQLHLGGTIILGGNVPLAADGTVDVSALTQVNDRLGEAARADGRDWPAVLSVDQEGGLVARLRAPLTEWPSPMTYGATGDPAMARTAQQGINKELAAVGFTMNYAPVADVTIGAADPTIGARAYSDDPALVAVMTRSAMNGALTTGVLPVLKHFPGHGSVGTDSHLGLPVQMASLAELRQRDWKPFRAAIEAGAPLVMMAHIAVQALNPGVPASVSAASYDALRDLGFAGVAVTDALNMAAITEQYPAGEAAVQALGAGADLLLMPADVAAAHAAITAAVSDGAVPAQRLDQAAARVVALLKWQESLSEPVSLDAVGSHQSRSRQASAAALTVLSGPCQSQLVDSSLQIQGGTERDRRRFREAATARGISTGAGPVVTLMDVAGSRGDGDIAVALGGPWVLNQSKAPVRLALYGRTPGAFDALLDFLTGVAPAPGALPVDLGAFERGTGCG